MPQVFWFAVERIQLIQDIHQHGHFGETAIYYKLYNDLRVWWPGMHNDIKLIINDCAACIQHTVVKDGYHPSRPIRASLPGEHWQIDGLC